MSINDISLPQRTLQVFWQCIMIDTRSDPRFYSQHSKASISLEEFQKYVFDSMISYYNLNAKDKIAIISTIDELADICGMKKNSHFYQSNEFSLHDLYQGSPELDIMNRFFLDSYNEAYMSQDRQDYIFLDFHLVRADDESIIISHRFHPRHKKLGKYFDTSSFKVSRTR